MRERVDALPRGCAGGVAGFGATRAAMFMRSGGGASAKVAAASRLSAVRKNIAEDQPRTVATTGITGDNLVYGASVTADLSASFPVMLPSSPGLAAAQERSAR